MTCNDSDYANLMTSNTIEFCVYSKLNRKFPNIIIFACFFGKSCKLGILRETTENRQKIIFDFEIGDESKKLLKRSISLVITYFTEHFNL